MTGLARPERVRPLAWVLVVGAVGFLGVGVGRLVVEGGSATVTLPAALLVGDVVIALTLVRGWSAVRPVAQGLAIFGLLVHTLLLVRSGVWWIKGWSVPLAPAHGWALLAFFAHTAEEREADDADEAGRAGEADEVGGTGGVDGTDEASESDGADVNASGEGDGRGEVSDAREPDAVGPVGRAEIVGPAGGGGGDRGAGAEDDEGDRSGDAGPEARVAEEGAAR